MVAVFSCGHSGRDCFWAVIRSFEVKLWITPGVRSSRSARVPSYGAHGLGVGSVLIGGFQQVRSMSAGSFPGLSNLELAISLEGTPTGGVHF